MSNYTTSSSTSYSSVSINGQETVSGHRQAHQQTTDADGNTRVQSVSQNLGEPATIQSRSYDAQGRETITSGTSGSNNRIEDVTQVERDRQYEENIEDE
jgi:hypothetical protein